MNYGIYKRGLMVMNQQDSTYFNIPSCINCKYFIDKQDMFQSQCKKFENFKKNDYELALIARSHTEKCGIAGKHFIAK
jgi:hypothetical protein